MTTKKWMLTHDSHKLKKGEIYEGEKLPAWLVGKAVLTASLTAYVTDPEADSLRIENNALKTRIVLLEQELSQLKPDPAFDAQENERADEQQEEEQQGERRGPGRPRKA